MKKLLIAIFIALNISSMATTKEDIKSMNDGRLLTSYTTEVGDTYSKDGNVYFIKGPKDFKNRSFKIRYIQVVDCGLFKRVYAVIVANGAYCRIDLENASKRNEIQIG